ncbi:FtsW/RodA/SpoVE family cell cycle protein [Paratractidigestivibacter sp.]|uniref:FtsW/RodA/SpoVE family cell cycle protein n=1 Tax=Paratractidigestivibacter sp. TaxID=2847316 RepID=UPI002AC958A2|nr:FtsW/RodA/SpoVE family cell cycle protein [Paratractidigestivibacter sp.]
MANDMIERGAGGGFLAGLAQKVAGREASKRVSGKTRPLSNFYLSQLIPAMLLVIIGVVTVWSASLTIAEARFSSHLIGIALGTVCAVLIWRYDTRALSGMTKVLLIAACVLMIMPYLPGLGYEAKGMTGWVQIPIIGFRFQPSEPSKLVVIFLMASACAQHNGKIETFADYCKLCGTLLLPLGLLVVTDLGTGLVVLFAGATIIICSGAPAKWVLPTIGLIVGAVALVIWSSMTDGMPDILKDYQLKRLLVFIDESVDPTGSGYNLAQAKIAVGSGGLLGKGIGNASQAGSGFLPEAHTDFVFALFAEQFGFVGSVVLLILFVWMILATLLLAVKMDNVFCKLVLVGCCGMWTFQVLENIGMCIGVMPITGIPLPFISFGSSSMVTQLTAVGIVQSIWRHRQKAA